MDGCGKEADIVLMESNTSDERTLYLCFDCWKNGDYDSGLEGLEFGDKYKCGSKPPSGREER